jgi:hypothetical protein
MDGPAVTRHADAVFVVLRRTAVTGRLLILHGFHASHWCSIPVDDLTKANKGLVIKFMRPHQQKENHHWKKQKCLNLLHTVVGTWRYSAYYWLHNPKLHCLRGSKGLRTSSRKRSVGFQRSEKNKKPTIEFKTIYNTEGTVWWHRRPGDGFSSS